MKRTPLFITLICLMVLFTACKNNDADVDPDTTPDEKNVTFEGIGYVITSNNTCYINKAVNCSGDYELSALKYKNKTYTIDSIAEKAFEDCVNLKSLKIPSSIKSIGRSAFYSSNLTSINIPSSVISIKEYTFYNCTNLTSITIPNSVTSIGEAAFIHCIGLTSITIPNSVTSIGSRAFLDCYGLKSIHIKSSTPIVLSTYFPFPSEQCTLYVPKGSKTLYEKAVGWNKFTNIVEE